MKSRIISITITILFITLAHSRVLTKKSNAKDSESSISLHSNTETRAQHNKIVNEAMKSKKTMDDESMSSPSQKPYVINTKIQSHETSSHHDESSLKSNHQVVVQVQVNKSNKSSHKELSKETSSMESHSRPQVNVVVVADKSHNNCTSHNNSDNSSLKTDPSMKDYDINQDPSHRSQPAIIKRTEESNESSSKNSDVIEEQIVNKGTQVLSEKSSDLDETSHKESRVSEGLKITSAFVGVATLMIML